MTRPFIEDVQQNAGLEKQISIICRGMTRCVDGMPYCNAQKAHIYVRIAAAMMQASQCEMADAVVQAQGQAEG